MYVEGESRYLYFFFCKQKTAYEMRISDWSSDVCSSDLQVRHRAVAGRRMHHLAGMRLHIGNEFAERGGLECGVGHQQHGDVGHQRYRLDVAQGVEIGRASCRERVCQYV